MVETIVTPKCPAIVINICDISFFHKLVSSHSFIKFQTIENFNFHTVLACFYKYSFSAE